MLEPHWDNHDDDVRSARVDALHECLDELTPNSRKIVEMRYADGVIGKSLAEALGKPVNTVYVALSRIHRRLADCVRRRIAREEHFGL
jgi:RNA polymerase sigma-70 factor (ECF subfamily)